jgi:rhodanese-related sulfurtransferase
VKISDWLSFKAVPQISVQSLHKQLNEDAHHFFLLDVRTHTEWKLSHIPASHSLPVFKMNITEIPTDKTIICICLTAHRSTPVVRELIRDGYDAYELSGGMRHWWKHKLPTHNSR